MDNKKFRLCLRLIAFTIALVLMVVHFEDILHGIGFFIRLLMPLIIGTVLAFVFQRPYESLRSWYQTRCRRRPGTASALAIATVYVLAFGAIGLIVATVVPELIQNIKTFAENADQYLLQMQSSLNRFTAGFGLRSIDLTALIETVDKYLGSFSTAMDQVLSQLIEVTSSFISGIATVFISIALSVYIMYNKEKLLSQCRRVLRAYLPSRVNEGLRDLMPVVSQVFGDYVSGQCKEAVILGLLCFAGMMILRIDYSGLISVIIAITALVPIMGAYIGGTVAVLLLLFVSPGKALLFLVFLIVLQQLEGNLIYPRVVGRKIGLPGMWVLLSISVWGGIFGIWGMLMGVPITTILYQLLKKDVQKRERKQMEVNGLAASEK